MKRVNTKAATVAAAPALRRLKELREERDAAARAAGAIDCSMGCRRPARFTLADGAEVCAACLKRRVKERRSA